MKIESHLAPISARGRLLSKLRTDYPLLFFMPAFIAGQAAAHFLSWHILLPAASGFLIYFVLYPGLTIAGFPAVPKMLLCGFLPGVLSLLLSQAGRESVQLMADRSYLMRADDFPRHKKVGLKELSVEVLAEKKRQPEADWVPLKHPVRLLGRTVHLPWRNSRYVTKDALFIARGEFSPLAVTVNPFSYQSNLRRRGYSYTARFRYVSRPIKDPDFLVERAQGWIARRVNQLLGNHEKAGLILSMSLGRRDLLSADTEKAFKRTGLAHLLVLSGYQVALFYYSIFQILIWLGTRSRTLCLLFPLSACAACAALAAAGGLVLLAGIEGASVRAVMALFFAAAASVTERAGGMANAILISLLLLAVLWPGIYFEPGVQLTYAALYGILLGLNGQGRLLTCVKVCFCASLCTTLVVLLWFGNLPFAAFPLNLLLTPVLNLIGCQGSLLALALYLSGLDYRGCLLRLVAYTLTLLRDFICYLSAGPICLEELGTGATIFWAVALGGTIFEVSRRRLRQYRLLNNV